MPLGGGRRKCLHISVSTIDCTGQHNHAAGRKQKGVGNGDQEVEDIANEHESILHSAVSDQHINRIEKQANKKGAQEDSIESEYFKERQFCDGDFLLPDKAHERCAETLTKKHVQRSAEDSCIV